MRLVGRRDTTLTFQNFKLESIVSNGKCVAASDTTDLVNHVAFWVPTFVAHVPINLHKLLQNGSIATCTLGGKACRVMIMAIYVIVVLII